MILNKKGQDYSTFNSFASWGFVEIPHSYIKSRRPIPEELLNKRKEHMQKLYEEGSPIAWIAQLYEMSRVQARRIIKNLPNH